MQNYKNILTASLYFSFIAYLNAFVAINMIDPLRYSEALPDYGHYFLPFISSRIPNYLLSFYIGYFCFKQSANQNLIEFTKFIWSMNLLFTLRLFTFSLTIEPPPMPRCIDRNPSQSFIWDVILNIFESSDNTCMDIMFSGHACYFTMICLYSLHQTSKYWERMTNYFIFIVGNLSIIAAHMHYSSDVIIGIALSTLLYNAVFGIDWKYLRNELFYC